MACFINICIQEGLYFSCYSNCKFLPYFSRLAFKGFATIVTLFYSIFYISFYFLIFFIKPTFFKYFYHFPMLPSDFTYKKYQTSCRKSRFLSGFKQQINTRFIKYFLVRVCLIILKIKLLVLQHYFFFIFLHSPRSEQKYSN